MESHTTDRQDTPEPAEEPREPREPREPLPTWRNTSPRENQEADRDDLARGRERWETVLGR
jgi:hypothetical protein